MTVDGVAIRTAHLTVQITNFAEHAHRLGSHCDATWGGVSHSGVVTESVDHGDGTGHLVVECVL